MNYADDEVKWRLFQQSRGLASKINDPIWTVFELILRFIHVPLICNWTSLRFFNNQGDLTLKSNDPIWPGFKLILPFIHVHLICKFQEDPIKTEWGITDGKVKQRLFQQSRGCNSKINDPIWHGFEIIRYFITVHLSICKFQENPIKTECLMLMTKSKAFSAINLASFPKPSGVQPCPPYPQVSGRSNRNWMSYADDKVKQRLFFFFFNNQGDISLGLMIRSCQFLNLFKISAMSTLSASFRKIQSKLQTVLRCCIHFCGTDRFCGTGPMTNSSPVLSYLQFCW